MNQKVAIGIVVVLALLAGGYLWYTNQSGAFMSADDTGYMASTTDGTQRTATPAEIQNGVEGNWRSADDARFTRTFNADGTITDRYEGMEDATVSGHWELNSDHMPGQVRELANGMPVLSIEFPEEALFFVVTKLGATELEMSYVGGAGKTLRFERI
ncbi:MAG: hypothetical protein V4681_03145 [Patescibacteria group bacterium]